MSIPQMLTKRNGPLVVIVAILVLAGAAFPRFGRSTPPTPRAAQEEKAGAMCEFVAPGASFSIPYVAHAPELNTDPDSQTWANASSTWITRDCTHQIDYTKLKTEVRAFWTDTDLYLLFVSPYSELNLWLP